MPQTQRTAAAKVQRNITALSCDERRRDGLLRASWNLITNGFKSKPAPTSSWYETATGDLTPWRQVVIPIRAAILKAVESGDEQLIEQTVEGARAFCKELEADFLSLVPARKEESTIALALAETEAEGSADSIEMALVAHPTPMEAEKAIGPLSRHLAALVLLTDGCRRLARENPRLEAARAKFFTPRTSSLFAADAKAASTLVTR